MVSDDFPTERGFLDKSLGTYEGMMAKNEKIPFSLTFSKITSN
jgi:hypothetical protein